MNNCLNNLNFLDKDMAEPDADVPAVDLPEGINKLFD